jgi:hypothetical protein
MKKLSLLFLAMILSFQVVAHCDSCGSSEDHAESEDTTHHEKDARYEQAREREKALMNESEDRTEDDMADNEDE